MLLMAGSTTVLGLLPTYDSIGLAAPVLLTLIRLLQGLSVGGEYIGSMSFLAEHAPPQRRGFLGSWTSFTVVLGSLLGSGTAALAATVLSAAQLAAWGWRVPFVGGLLIGVVGFWLRMGVQESPSFLKLQTSGKLAANPIAEAVRSDRGAIMTTFGLSAITGVGFYLPFVWLPTWLAQINRPPLAVDQALLANTMGLLALLLLTPLTAVISDRVGRKPMFLGAAVGYVILSYPVFWRMADGTFGSALIGRSCSRPATACSRVVWGRPWWNSSRPGPVIPVLRSATTSGRPFSGARRRWSQRP